MREITGKNVLVVGLGKSGLAAARLLAAKGARVLAVDSETTAGLKIQAEQLRLLGVEVRLGAVLIQTPRDSRVGRTVPGEPSGGSMGGLERLSGGASPYLEEFDLVVVSPGVPPELPLLAEIRARGTPIIGELELGWQQGGCKAIAITGTNGKTTTTELTAQMLKDCGRQTVAAGNIGLPLCDVAAEAANKFEILTLEVSSFQLETIEEFSPSIAVLLNIAPDHLDRYASMAEYVQAKARVFEKQAESDWAVIQSEAMDALRQAGIAPKARVVTFSATDAGADIHLDRGRIVGKAMELNLADCKLKGGHNAENLMAALAIAKALGLPEAGVRKSLETYEPAPHRCEEVGRIDGILFVNDSKATNPHAVAQAIRAMPTAPGSERNILLIAGGKEKQLPYGELAPLLACRVKRAYLLGETRLTLLSAWSPFTPCALTSSLIEAVTNAFEDGKSGDVVLLSPACSSFDMFRDYQHRGEEFRSAVHGLRKKIREFGDGAARAVPTPH